MKAENITYEDSFKGNNRLLVGIVFSVLTYWLFSQSLLNMAPDIQSDLGISSGILSIGVSITGLVSGIFIVVAGGLADKLGRVKVTYFGILLNILGSLALIMTGNSAMFLIGRALQGFSGACIMPATMAIVKSYYHGKERQRALSYWSIGSWGGSGLCSFFGGAVDSSLGWRYVFVFSIIISILSGILLLGTPESVTKEDTKKNFDVLGLFLFVISMLSLNLVVSKGTEFGWGNPLTIGLIAIVFVGIYLFYRLERSRENSFVDFSLFENKGYLGATISNFSLNAIAGTLIIINSYVQQGRGLSAAKTGLLSIGYLVTVLVTIRIGEKLLQKIGARKPMIWGALLSGIGVLLMTLTFVDGNAYLVLVFIGYSFFGTGLGIYATPSTDTAISSVPLEKAGVASGIYKMASSLGGALGVAVSSSIYSGLSHNTNFSEGATTGLFVNILFCLLAIISITLIIPKEMGGQK